MNAASALFLQNKADTTRRGEARSSFLALLSPQSSLFGTMALLCLLFLGTGTVFVNQTHAAVWHNIGPFKLWERQIGETFIEPDNTKATVSENFTAEEMAAVLSSMEYWTERIGADKGPHVVVNLAKKGGDDTAYNWEYSTEESCNTYRYIVENEFLPVPSPYGYHTEIIFQNQYSAAPTRLLMNDSSITSTITHEMMHALGMVGMIDESDNRMFARSKAWTVGLSDIFGTRAEIGKEVRNAPQQGTLTNNIFYLPALQASPFGKTEEKQFPVFRGAAVDSLTNNRGMPVMAGLGFDYKIDGGNVLGHPALLGSIMSYSPLRNMLFSELELAVLKDMGYAVDLKKSFGKSYYPDNLGGKLTYVGATAGYLAQAATETTNEAGFDSNYSYGVGMHVYRDNLTVTQRGHIKASGFGAGGIRVDGVNNALTVPQGTYIGANGEYGTGVLTSYGKNNVLTIAGTVEALGRGSGVGLHFGLTGNIMDTNHHSYKNYDYEIRGADKNSDDIYFYTKMNADLAGPLAKTVNISGSVSGGLAAIQIDRDSHVQNINILNGAELNGNINVRWDMWNHTLPGGPNMQRYGTNLNIGVLPSGAPDRNFFLTYNDTIDGRAEVLVKGPNPPEASSTALSLNESALAVNFMGGTTSLNGTVYAHEVVVNAGSILKGKHTIVVSSAYGGTGEVTVIPGGTHSKGNSIGTARIFGNYHNDGRLHMEFDAQGRHDILEVTGKFDVEDARVTLAPVKGHYRSGTIALDLTKMFKLANPADTPDFDRLWSLRSPTLSFAAASLNAPEVIVQVRRDADAYSRYATTKNGAALGRALPGIGEAAQGEMQDLFTLMDFSDRDGALISAALPQLTAAPYAQTAKASAEANLHLGRMALSHLRNSGASLQGQSADDATPWSAFVMPFGTTSAQQDYKGVSGYGSSGVGVMGGVSRQGDQWTTSLYTAFSRRQVDTWTSAGAQARSSALHVGAAAHWAEGKDRGWQAWGQAQLGLENTDMRRSVAFGEYSRRNSSFWTSLNGTASLGGAYLWQAGSLSLGPQIGLEYAFNALPAIEEDDGGATSLGMDAYTRHDLRGVAGLMTTWSTEFGQGRGLRATMEAVWRQDMLPPQRDTGAHFTGYSQFPFDTRLESNGLGSLGLVGNVQVSLREDVTLSAQMEADVLRPGYSSFGGGFSLRWEF